MGNRQTGDAGANTDAGGSMRVFGRIGEKRSELQVLRRQGMVPGAVFGKKIEPTLIAVDEKELRQLLRGHSGEVLDIEVPGQGRHKVVLKEVQRDKVAPGRLLHVDFHQINMNEPIKTMVRIEYTGQAAGVAAGGVMQTIAAELEVRALPTMLPSAIEADVSALDIGDKLLAADVRLPDGVECLTPPDTVLATVLHVQKLAEEPEDSGADSEADKEADKQGEPALE